ncbi:hypothetical protein Ga0100231_021835 [Opitutaceae bacterium TAV4]|uniref:hypothetical protein n=1 Tax=Geminisphaera colitermitum TaxID=1148786 RepID=UPI000158C677|nr:hypothetical protein [Geminisphaera colitermitum]RRJ96487.1 hypothetical protein Ga0100231_021835 [Opitutaceae bacterium TAV4]RRK01953.1 hypothetical protein Ga0100230_001640 [Opitutaceae bacterium TAV3]
MSLLLATLLPGLALLALGGLFLTNNSLFTASLRRLPRSRRAAAVFFCLGAAWFLWNVWHLSPADFGEYRKPLTFAFAIIAVLSWLYVPEFLAVRGLSILVLLAASPLLHAAYQEYEHPARLFMVTLVFAGILLALWLGAQPYKLRDFIEWLYRTPGRSRALGAACIGYGALLSIIAFTY